MVEQGTVRKPSSKGGCFRTGCFGCLGVLLLAVILPLAYAFIEMARGVPDLHRETESLSQILPGTHDTALPGMPPPGSEMAAVGRGDRTSPPATAAGIAGMRTSGAVSSTLGRGRKTGNIRAATSTARDAGVSAKNCSVGWVSVSSE